MGRIEGWIANRLGWHHTVAAQVTGETAADTGTRLAHERTDLALDRSYLAAERTLQAWVRTALSMISFGFTLGKLSDAIHGEAVVGALGNRTWSIKSVAYYLVVIGTISLVGATLQHWVRVRRLNAMGLPRQLSIAFVVALMLAVVGGFAFSALVLKL